MLVIATIFALVAFVWVAVAVRHGGLILGCLLVIATGSCLGHPFFHLSVLTLDRALCIALCGLYLIYRHVGRTDAKPLTLADGLLFVFLAVLLCSTFSHDWRLDHAQPASRLLLLYLMPAAIYWVARQSPLTDRQVRWTMAGLAAFACYLSVTALAEIGQQHRWIVPKYIVTSEFREFLGRGRGPFLNPVANGLFMTTGLGCLLMMWPRLSRAGRSLLILTALVIGAGTFATLTRCVWLGTSLALMLIVVVNLPARQRWGALVLTTCLAVVGLSVGWKTLLNFKRDTHLSAAETAESAQLRPMLAAVGWQMFCDHPLMGVGLGQYTHRNDEYIAARTIDWPLDRVRPYHQHNVILSLMSETGLLGTLPFVVLLSCWSRSAWQLWKSPTLSLETRQLGLVFLVSLISYLVSGMFQDVALIPMANLLLFFLAGLTISALLSADEKGSGVFFAREFRRLAEPTSQQDSRPLGADREPKPCC